MPEPRLVAALGDCAAGCAVLGDPAQLAGPLERILPVDLRIPGCPPNPQQIADALLCLMAKSGRDASAPRSSDEYTSIPLTDAGGLHTDIE